MNSNVGIIQKELAKVEDWVCPAEKIIENWYRGYGGISDWFERTEEAMKKEINKNDQEITELKERFEGLLTELGKVEAGQKRILEELDKVSGFRRPVKCYSAYINRTDEREELNMKIVKTERHLNDSIGILAKKKSAIRIDELSELERIEMEILKVSAEIDLVSSQIM